MSWKDRAYKYSIQVTSLLDWIRFVCLIITWLEFMV